MSGLLIDHGMFIMRPGGGFLFNAAMAASGQSPRVRPNPGCVPPMPTGGSTQR